MATIASLATDAAKTAHAHVAQLLASRQVKPGDKLPLKQTVKETEPADSFSLAPTGKNIFVRVPCLSSPFPLHLFEKWIVFLRYWTDELFLQRFVKFFFTRLTSTVHENM